MTNLNDFLNDQMKDPAFKAEWEALAPEFSVIEAILKARKESSFLSARESLRRISASWSAETQAHLCAHCRGWPPVWECALKSSSCRKM